MSPRRCSGRNLSRGRVKPSNECHQNGNRNSCHDTGQSRPARVLLVEDEQAIRDIIVPWLFADEFDCREAADGRAGMDLLAGGIRINLVLSNILLPVVDGFALLTHVKQRYPRIPFAFVTAVLDIQVRDAAMERGADGYLLKPFTNEAFLTMVRDILGRPPRR